jgi:two-component system nitrogen regulation response regulator GlnG
METLLVIDDDPVVTGLFRQVFEPRGLRVVTATSATEGIALADHCRPDLAAVSVLLPDGTGLHVFRQLQQLDSKLPVIVMTSGGGSGMAIEAMQMGAMDYLLKPMQVNDLVDLVRRGLEIRRLMSEPVAVDPKGSSLEVHGDVMIGRCPAMQEVYKAVGRVASQNISVLIRGESGTGKELVARALYQYSSRSTGPFLAVNCAAIPESLLESELFGHEKGAFTGADRKRIGKFEQCNGGTLFLDEIGDMALPLQSKLLRVLQEKCFERVGGNETITVDVRVVAATHRTLEAMTAEGRFRDDLYYRLNGFTIDMPPLRDRNGDLELLVHHFLRAANADLGKNVSRVSPDAMQILCAYHWPGNIRELQSAIRQAILQSTGTVLLPDFLPNFVGRGGGPGASPSRSVNSHGAGRVSLPAITATGNRGQETVDDLIQRHFAGPEGQVYDGVMEDIERRLIAQTLERAGGNQTEAARLLGITRTTIRAKIQKLGIGIRRIVQADSD